MWNGINPWFGLQLIQVAKGFDYLFANEDFENGG